MIYECVDLRDKLKRFVSRVLLGYRSARSVVETIYTFCEDTQTINPYGNE